MGAQKNLGRGPERSSSVYFIIYGYLGRKDDSGDDSLAFKPDISE